MGKTGIVVVDMQPGFLSRLSSDSQLIRERDAVTSNIAQLLYAGASSGLQLFFLEYVSRFFNYGGTIPPLHLAVASGYAKAAIEPRLHVIKKRHANGFTGTSLETRLREADVTDIALAGINGAVCVKETAEGAIASGFGVVTSYDLQLNERFPLVDTNAADAFYTLHNLLTPSFRDVIASFGGTVDPKILKPAFDGYQLETSQVMRRSYRHQR